jgi:hypothetical protein
MPKYILMTKNGKRKNEKVSIGEKKVAISNEDKK